MARFLKSRLKSKGKAPGSLIFIGNQKMDACRIRLIKYNGDMLIESEITDIQEAFQSMDEKSVYWFNVDGLHDVSVIEEFGHKFNISPLVLENILNTDQRAKYMEDLDTITTITKALYYDKENKSISVEQISFILGNNFLVSFQERIGDHFETVRERLRHGVGKMRQSGTDYLMYTLMDCLVDNYLIDIESIGNEIEKMEVHLEAPTKETSEAIYHFKREIMYIQKILRPHKELLIKLLRSNTSRITKNSMIYYQELNDMLEQAQDAIDNYFNMISDQMNMYNTHVSTKVNEVVKVLTIFASIFIPLTFIAGIYGTNFDHLPALHYYYGYYAMWGFMVVLAIVMLVYFKRKKWF